MDGLDEMDGQDKQTGRWEDKQIERRREERGEGEEGGKEEEWAGRWMDEQMSP